MTKKLTVRGGHDEKGVFMGFIQQGLTVKEAFKIHHALEALKLELQTAGFNIATLEMTVTDEETEAKTISERNAVAG